jgi:AraC family transcriptional regulator of adaptative response/methylated-DNA-[protein]-cysteine methyltransferase
VLRGKRMNFEEKYAVIGTKDSRYEGLFITAVTSTGIFCRPSCSARKPKRENVKFFDSVQEALRHGFRPCKMCKPLEKAGETPQYIKDIIKEIHENPFQRIKDQDLRERKIEPATIRRWFQKNHNITFHGYQRMIRINLAYNQIKGGNSITESAFAVGYDSLSGFNEGYKSIFGGSARDHMDKNVLTINRFSTKLGPMFALCSDQGLCLLEFTDRRMLEREFVDLRKKMNAVILPGKHPLLEATEKQIHEYFEGKRRSFDIPLVHPGSEFQQTVWNQLKSIGYGETRSYKEQAEAIGNPKAVRAVARANGMNRIAIIVPCHRVIGSDGSLTGYAGGLDRKQWMLDFEKQLKVSTE